MSLRNHPEILEIEKKFQDKGVPFEEAYELLYEHAVSEIPQGIQAFGAAYVTDYILEILKRELMNYLVANAPTILDAIFSWIKSLFFKNAKQ